MVRCLPSSVFIFIWCPCPSLYLCLSIFNSVFIVSVTSDTVEASCRPSICVEFCRHILTVSAYGASYCLQYHFCRQWSVESQIFDNVHRQVNSHPLSALKGGLIQGKDCWWVGILSSITDIDITRRSPYIYICQVLIVFVRSFLTNIIMARIDMH